MQGKVFKPNKTIIQYESYCIDSELKPEKIDADCIGSENKCSTYDFISYKNDLDLFELSIMVRKA